MKKVKKLNKKELEQINGGSDGSTSASLNLGLSTGDDGLLSLGGESRNSDGDYRRSNVTVGKGIDLRIGGSTDNVD